MVGIPPLAQGFGVYALVTSEGVNGMAHGWHNGDSDGARSRGSLRLLPDNRVVDTHRPRAGTIALVYILAISAGAYFVVHGSLPGVIACVFAVVVWEICHDYPDWS